MAELQVSGIPDPAMAADLAEFIGLLDRLRVWGGNPSFRTVASLVGPLLRPPQPVSKSTIADMFQPGRRRLNQDLVVAVVRALGLDERAVDQWRKAYVRVHAQAKTRPRGHLAPAELSADLIDFTGRAAVVERLLALLDERPARPVGPVVLTAISGQGGVGKTSLAIHVAHRVVTRFPDGQLQADLQGAGPVPVAPHDVLGRFLRALGMAPESIAGALEERAAQYRSMLAKQRVLILLDNVRDAAQVRLLLPGAGSSVALITSRSSLAGLDGANRVTLGAMDEEDSLRLLTRIAGESAVNASPEATDDLLRLCAGLPLAIRIAAARLATEPALTARRLVARLHDESARLNELQVEDRAVRATFAVGYDSLGPAARNAFALLALVPGQTVSLPAAAALLDGSPQSTEEVLAELLDAALLEPAGPKRYRFHDLIKVFAVECAHDAFADADGNLRSHSEAAVDRLLEWYLHTAVEAATAIHPNRRAVERDPIPPGRVSLTFTDPATALDWGDREQANLTAAVHHARRTGRHRQAWQLAITLWSQFQVRSAWADWIATHELALESAAELGDTAAQSWILNCLSPAYQGVGRYQDAIGSLERALDIRLQTDDLRGAASCLINIGFIRGELGEHDQAITATRRALTIYQELGFRAGQMLARINIGELDSRRGKPEDAVEHFQRALADSIEIGDRYQQGKILANLAASQLALERHGEAAQHATQAAALCKEQGNRFDEATSYRTLGLVAAAKGQNRLATTDFNRAIAIFTELEAPEAEETRRIADRVTGRQS
ncbi:tetratricopeptide (TPR) repeat protein [Kitasatospora sp. MAP12-15]|uniref:tetratricopeptide repeat protein n=1 Tax=unclassified Kitasatospora TaxID=2633591 RepID=UPI0024754D8D|nr:tetratricopeptide repeat protein [Kitasatospora sp. MAP12-44]MDH6115687.1 tetratricopeptide (TPR) repeat protein [Kitasatospora sp. MAP12-44]